MVMVLLSFILALSLAPQSVAVGPVAPADRFGVEVSSYYWGRLTKPNDMPSPFSAQRANRARRWRRGMEPPPPEIRLRETYVLVRNTGTRKVKAITWDYVFFEDAKHEREVRRFRFHTKQKLEPGEMKFLVSGVDQAAPTSFGEVRIEAVEFDN